MCIRDRYISLRSLRKTFAPLREKTSQSSRRKKQSSQKFYDKYFKIQIKSLRSLRKTFAPLREKTLLNQSINFIPKCSIKTRKRKIRILRIRSITHSYNHHIFTRDYINSLIFCTHCRKHITWCVRN